MTSYCEALIKTIPTINKHSRGREWKRKILHARDGGVGGRDRQTDRDKQRGRERDRKKERVKDVLCACVCMRQREKEREREKGVLLDRVLWKREMGGGGGCFMRDRQKQTERERERDKKRVKDVLCACVGMRQREKERERKGCFIRQSFMKERNRGVGGGGCFMRGGKERDVDLSWKKERDL